MNEVSPLSEDNDNGVQLCQRTVAFNEFFGNEMESSQVNIRSINNIYNDTCNNMPKSQIIKLTEKHNLHACSYVC